MAAHEKFTPTLFLSWSSDSTLSIVTVIISPVLSRNRNLIGVIFPFVSVQEIICTGISTHSMLSKNSTPLFIWCSPIITHRTCVCKHVICGKLYLDNLRQKNKMILYKAQPVLWEPVSQN